MKTLARLALTGIVLILPVQAVHAQSGTMIEELQSVAERAWASATGVASSVWNYVTPSNAGGLLTKQIMAYDVDESLDMKTLMSAAGYSIKRIETGVSVVPHLSMKYARSRELAEHDLNYAYRLLRKHAKTDKRPAAYIQRAIVGAVLDVQNIKSYTLESVEVDILPLPKVKFVSVPNNAPLGEEASRLMRAIDRLNETIAQK